jgi:hypothetical protein
LSRRSARVQPVDQPPLPCPPRATKERDFHTRTPPMTHTKLANGYQRFRIVELHDVIAGPRQSKRSNFDVVASCEGRLALHALTPGD